MDEEFNELLETMQPVLLEPNELVNWNKVYSNVDALSIQLHILNSLFTCKDNEIEKKFIELLNYDEKILLVVPSIIALSSQDKNIVDCLLSVGEIKLNFLKRKNTDSEYVEFLRKVGFFNIFTDKKVSNLYDYIVGVEVGRDTHARKNRTGKKWKKLFLLF